MTRKNSFDLSSLTPPATAIPSSIAEQLNRSPKYYENGQQFECIIPEQIELNQHIVFVPHCSLCDDTGYINEALNLPCVCLSQRMKINACND